MMRLSYRERDHTCGQTWLTSSATIGLTQSDFLGDQTLCVWYTF
jgi:hypothetical protein